MAPPTRYHPFRSLSPEPLKGKEARTPRKCQFFDALRREGDRKPLCKISEEAGISESCGRKWRDQYKAMGSEACRRTRPKSAILGHKSKVTKAMCKQIVNPSNLVREQPYEAQIAHYNIDVGKRQLQRMINRHTRGGGRYLMAFVKKTISDANRQQRKQYGADHEDAPIEGYWDHIIWTDEAHIDPTSQARKRVSREQGTRDDPENITERPPLKGVRFHIAAWISWYGKAEKLEFYNDEEDEVEIPPYPLKPRRRPTTESEEEYKQRVKEWEAGKPHPRDVTVRGNSMTQKYYVERLLPIYCDAVQAMSQIDNKQWLLQEDGDPSHGMRKDGLAQQYKRDRGIQNLSHPAQSPDLNPIEAIWSIIKQRLRRRIFDSEEEMKEALQDEWSRITLTQIRERIACMPSRCAQLKASGGGPIRGKKW